MALVPNGYDPREGIFDIKKRFQIAQDGHRPTDEQLAFQLEVRQEIHKIAQKLNAKVEDGREKSLALTKLEEALMWAGKAIFQ